MLKREFKLAEVEVETQLGKLKGVCEPDRSLYKFLGVPFAEAPVGENRFKPPVPKEPWKGVLNATDFGPCCPQEYDPVEGAREDFGGDFFNEDSLLLNIWTPGFDQRKRAVMVWIHGGANFVGTARAPFYDGSNLSSFGDVVVVSIQYRLVIFGFFDVSGLGSDEYNQCYNNGIKDQLCALQWIQQNISVFGGDPNNVTLFGESSGGMNISCLMTIEPQVNLFHKAILQSGNGGVLRSRHEAKNSAKDFFRKFKIKSMKQLLEMGTEELILKSFKWISTFGALWQDDLFLPVIDGDMIPKSPVQALEEGKNASIPMMIGWTAHELRYWLEYSKLLQYLPGFIVKKNF